ncbi:MAG: type II toxin-antitoxin system RelE/ParE family toxin [Lachnospiraceae bacterium]|nr:type II toxin-antitoxin system RelE/ParE family toxin [Lachnospiraceae bacterium]
MELEKICISGINNTYAISNVKKEFRKAVDEPWKSEPPWKRYQQKLIEDLAVLEQEKEKAIDLQHFEKLIGVDRLYSIRHPESKKNIRIIYTIEEEAIILLVAFLEKNDGDYQRAISTAKKRLQWLDG